MGWHWRFIGTLLLVQTVFSAKELPEITTTATGEDSTVHMLSTVYIHVDTSSC